MASFGELMRSDAWHAIMNRGENGDGTNCGQCGIGGRKGNEIVERLITKREMNLSGEMCEKVLLALKRDGADLIGDGVRKPTGKAYGELRLRKVAGIEILLKGIAATPRIVVRLENNECTEDQKQKFESIFRESKNCEQVYALTNTLIENGEVSGRAIKEIHECYVRVVDKMTNGPEKRLFYNRLDARRRQFERPKSCDVAISKLEHSLLFAMSHGSHELFHTNVWAWLIKNEHRFAAVFFPELSKHEIKEVRREQGNRDLTIWVDEGGNQKAYVVENKFKSTPREEQLADYQSKLSGNTLMI